MIIIVVLGAKTSPETTHYNVLLGQRIFFDKQFSGNGNRACASCHAPELAYTDGYRRSLGLEADVHLHNAPSLLNTFALQRLTWADSTVRDFRSQMQKPFFNQKTKEMGLQYSDTTLILQRLRHDKTYRYLFAQAQKTITWHHVEGALSDYLQQLKTDTTTKTLNEAALRGKKIFFSDTTKCATCHVPPYYTVASLSSDAYFNIGLYAKYPKNDSGLAHLTKKKKDNGKFRVPSLINVALTAPYMHDGSISTLNEVIDIFEAGGQKEGRSYPNKSVLIKGFRLSPNEKRDLIAFLYSLTDTTFLQKPLSKNPFL